MRSVRLFRSDLFYRLNVFPITIPPLRDHPEDIPVLARHFTRKYALEMGRKIDTIPPETLEALSRWNWPGNVRELENFIERSVILSRDSVLQAPMAELRPKGLEGVDGTLANMERQLILRVLRATGGVITTTARRLGIPRSTLNAKMQKLGISRRDVR